ncbi:MAG TPA: hypothetical protein VFC19_14515 [Candidatus Limnocylindrales bacterium]|nr:hypothetical protein [Candidatus Limnocylindrales bacterium]
MPDDLTPMFHSLRQVAGRRPLAPVGEIHRAGMRRRTVRRDLVVAACAFFVIAVAGTVAALGNSSVPRPPNPLDSSPPAPSSTPEPSSSPQPSVLPVDNACAPQDFDPRPWYAAEGAMGTAFQTVILKVRADGRECVLDGPPVLEGRPRSAGAIAPIPLRPSGIPALRVSPGWYVSFTLSSPNNPEACRKQYTDVSLVLGEKRYPLKAFEASVHCFDEIVGWGRAAEPNETNYPTVNRAPA